ncbi:MAG: CopG family transcriptional regulator [Bryobacteraceae bacterium]|jgi:hypothetical protein
MPRITIYLPNDIEKLARKTAKSKRMSVSRWTAEYVVCHAAGAWPKSVLNAAGAIPDFPSLKEIRKGYGRDARRVPTW